MCPKNHPNVGKYTIHGAYGYDTSNHREAHQERFVLPPGSPYGPRPSWPTKECQAHWALMKIDDLPMNMVSVMIFRTYLELPQGMSF